QRDAQSAAAAAREAIGRVVDERLVVPVAAVLGEHRAAREATAPSAVSSTGRHLDGLSTG
ncbi:hypothetical protein, partial [Actinotalea sp. JY-7885]